MRKELLVLLLAVLFIGAAVANKKLVIKEDDKDLAEIELKRSDEGKVAFHHYKHNLKIEEHEELWQDLLDALRVKDNYSITCNACHHRVDPATEKLDDVKPCFTCHLTNEQHGAIAATKAGAAWNAWIKFHGAVDNKMRSFIKHYKIAKKAKDTEGMEDESGVYWELHLGNEDYGINADSHIVSFDKFLALAGQGATYQSSKEDPDIEVSTTHYLKSVGNAQAVINTVQGAIKNNRITEKLGDLPENSTSLEPSEWSHVNMETAMHTNCDNCHIKVREAFGEISESNKEKGEKEKEKGDKILNPSKEKILAAGYNIAEVEAKAAKIKANYDAYLLRLEKEGKAVPPAEQVTIDPKNILTIARTIAPIAGEQDNKQNNECRYCHQ